MAPYRSRSLPRLEEILAQTDPLLWGFFSGEEEAGAELRGCLSPPAFALLSRIAAELPPQATQATQTPGA